MAIYADCAGLEQCWWPGRNQIIKKGRVSYYLDGAHTPQSMKVTGLREGGREGGASLVN